MNHIFFSKLQAFKNICQFVFALVSTHLSKQHHLQNFVGMSMSTFHMFFKITVYCNLQFTDRNFKLDMLLNKHWISEYYALRQPKSSKYFLM